MRLSKSLHTSILSILLTSSAFAQAPDSLSFQGFLTDTSGVVVADGNYNIVFKLYKDGSQVWEESHPSVAVKNGSFEVLLGDSTPLDTVAFNVPMTLGIKVGADPEMQPRTPLGAAPYAKALPGFYTFYYEDGESNKSYNVVGGAANNAIGDDVTGATIGGGGGFFSTSDVRNRVLDDWGTVSGGFSNTASGKRATVGGGVSNTASGFRSTIAGGHANLSSGDISTIGGGLQSVANATGATVAGGRADTAGGSYATVTGGFQNLAGMSGSTVGGGTSNKASGEVATIGGGDSNRASDYAATVGGGNFNKADGQNAVIAGGNANMAPGQWSSVGGGSGNKTTNDMATVGGGGSNLASGVGATVPGGRFNEARGQDSFAAGRNSRAAHSNSFVWSDGTAGASGVDSLVTFGSRQFLVKSTGGIWFFSSADTSAGVQLAPGSGSWTSVSSVFAKDDFEAVSRLDVLERLSRVPVRKWRYKDEPSDVRHLGPTSQDFFSVFGLGHTDRGIDVVDADGVALAAIQGLYQLVKNQQTLITEQAVEIERMRAAMRRAGIE